MFSHKNGRIDFNQVVMSNYNYGNEKHTSEPQQFDEKLSHKHTNSYFSDSLSKCLLNYKKANR